MSTMASRETTAKHLAVPRPTRDSIQGKIRQALQQSPYADVRKASCTVQKGVAILHGRVCSFYHKQVAQTIVRAVAGVNEVVNKLTVVYPAERP